MDEKEGDMEDDTFHDGSWEENGPVFVKTDELQEILVLDPDVSDHDELDIERAKGDKEDDEAAMHDVAEVEKLAEAVRGEVLAPPGGAPPTGWRVDSFGEGKGRRLVSVPPWSRRPPKVWPEQWVGSPRRVQEQLRADWKKEDPAGYEAQDERRLTWQRAKAAGKTAAKVTVVRGTAEPLVPARAMDRQEKACSASENIVASVSCTTGSRPRVPEVSSDAREETVQPLLGGGAVEECGFGCLLNSSAIERDDVCVPIVSDDNDKTTTTTTNNDYHENNNTMTTMTITTDNDTTALSEAARRLRSGNFEGCLLEMCCDDDSELSRRVRPEWLAVRVTRKVNALAKNTKRMIHSLLRLCVTLCIHLHTWIAVPCTAGCRWKYVNSRLGRVTGDVDLTENLIKVCLDICRHTAKAGGTWSWEWPRNNLLWKQADVRLFMQREGSSTCIVHSSAVGLSFDRHRKTTDDKVFVIKQWRIETSHPRLPIVLGPYATAGGGPKGGVRRMSWPLL
jgi:hypothetical protein